LPTLALLPAGTAAAQAPAGPLASAEQAFEAARFWDDQARLLRSLGRDTTPSGIPAAGVRDSLHRAADRFAALLAAVPEGRLTSHDRAARASLAESAGEFSAHLSPGTDTIGGRSDSLGTLTDAILFAYTRAANRIVVGGDTLNRLAVLGRLGSTGDSALRRQLFTALEPLWQSVNGGDEPTGPYRTLLRLRRAAWGQGGSPIEQKGPAFGLTTADLEAWLLSALRAWKAATPDSLLEPWEWYYYAGAASRRLSPRIPRIADLRRINDAYYAALGAAPSRLHIRYDLEARPGKYPVAYTDFGSRNRWINGAFTPGEPWVFTSYLDGGLDNLAELLHESGHAIHIAAIRTRPADLDWPDNDTFTEALADLPALDLYEPAWQQQFLGDSAPLAESLRGKYASIVMDMAWALFEIRVHRDADTDPNRVWADITSTYLHIRPHPEWSWWAMRGQLIDGPGYLVNYALGAFLVADLRQTVRERWGGFTPPTVELYPRLAGAIYQFGRSRPSRRVLEDVLGRPARPDALLADLARMSR
jgi:hypothetical protein